MNFGDFTDLAKYYVDRPGYSLKHLKLIRNYIIDETRNLNLRVADVGAGTGKLTKDLSSIGLSGVAVEPNDAMRAEGIKLFSNNKSFEWRKGSAEQTGLENNSYDWVLMGSSFHWTDSSKSSSEFNRILTNNGFFTAIWNTRDISRNPINIEVENMIYSYVPKEKRTSTGAIVTTELMKKKLKDQFSDIIFIEDNHMEVMSKERYINVWKSVNDIQVQAGEDKFNEIISNIESIVKDVDEIVMHYKIRSWTARVNK